MARLTGRRVVLTGASRGVGRETVKLFCAEGAELIGVARDTARLEALAREYPAFMPVTGDITDRGLGKRLAAAVKERWGACDLLINNAAIQEYNAGFHAEPLDALERNLTTNVLSAQWLIHALLPLLEQGVEPRIINVSSGAGKLDAVRGEPSMPAYRLSKLLLNGLSLSYAADLKGQVAVNS